MTEKERIYKVFDHFENSGLVNRDLEEILACLSDRIIGIGIGEQGFVNGKDDVRAVFTTGLKEEADTSYSLRYERVEILLCDPCSAALCAKVVITAEKDGNETESFFMQSLSFTKENDDWKICCLHASAPVVTKEVIEAYPLKFAEKTLQNLREEIGEEVYAVEEQYRKAVLADTVAFYIINFTANMFEKCQLNNDLCIYVNPGTPYESFINNTAADYVAGEDKDLFIKTFGLDHINKAFADQEKEIRLEYRMYTAGHDTLWMVTIARLITDIVTHELKGIMYVKNIDRSKKEELEIRERAARDDMTGLFHKNSFIRAVTQLLENDEGSLLMLDIDNFKKINDTYGHPAGDRVLADFAVSLNALCAPDSVIGRLGGDEFGVFLPGRHTTEELAALAGQLSGNRHVCISSSQETYVNFSCSIGIAAAARYSSFDSIYRHADKALYLSKRNGKQQFCFYQKD